MTVDLPVPEATAGTVVVPGITGADAPEAVAVGNDRPGTVVVAPFTSALLTAAVSGAVTAAVALTDVVLLRVVIAKYEKPGVVAVK